MRDFKFRCWDKRTEKWITNFSVSHDGLIFTLEGTEKLAWQHINGDFVHLMEWTGLLDKNGKEIYEEDVIQRTIVKKEGKNNIEIKAYFLVRWIDAAFWAQSREVGGINFATPQILSDFLKEDDEIIGNCYENPDLIKTN